MFENVPPNLPTSKEPEDIFSGGSAPGSPQGGSKPPAPPPPRPPMPSTPQMPPPAPRPMAQQGTSPRPPQPMQPYRTAVPQNVPVQQVSRPAPSPVVMEKPSRSWLRVILALVVLGGLGVGAYYAFLKKDELLGLVSQKSVDCKEDKTCLEKQFKDCKSASGQFSIDLGPFGGTVTYRMEILGPKDNLCEVKSSFIQNPNPVFLNADMICLFDNSKPLENAGQDISRCSGKLYDLLTNPSSFQTNKQVTPPPPEAESVVPPPPIDSDGDGLTDEDETRLGTDPLKADSDDDGLLDNEEVRIYKSDPMNPDTDGDGFKDGDEVKNGYNPIGTGRLFQVPAQQ